MMRIIFWCLWERWVFMSWANDYNSRGYTPGDRFKQPMDAFYKNDLAGCRSSPFIWRDMNRIIRNVRWL